MIDDPEQALRHVRSSSPTSGVRVALDDFGTGYSSLSLLQRFPLQRIKIDRAFVNSVADNDHDRALVRTILAMGESLGLEVVAEGVETIEQLAGSDPARVHPRPRATSSAARCTPTRCEAPSRRSPTCAHITSIR